MMLKTVYGAPPEDEERIEAIEVEEDDEIREKETVEHDKSVVVPAKKRLKKVT